MSTGPKSESSTKGKQQPVTQSKRLGPEIRTFGSVETFWRANVVPGAYSCVERDGFEGKMDKGYFEDSMLRRITAANLERMNECSCIIVEEVKNLDPTHTGNWTCKDESLRPARSGKFESFLDEVESVAIEFGLHTVWVVRVLNPFLRKKLERLDYDNTAFPDVVKDFPSQQSNL